ncbi:MAG: hypothetical protein AAF433_18225 [Bacteroidota bacterium]
MKLICLAVALSLQLGSLSAQERAAIPTGNFHTLNLADNFFGIHLEPLSWLVAADGRLRIGIVAQRANVSYLLDLEWGSAGLGGGFVSNDFELVEGYRYQGIRPEIRVHWPRFWGTGYLGLEYAYSHSLRHLEDAGYFDPDFSPGADIFAYDSAQREISRHGLGLKYGRTLPLFRRFYADIYVGISRVWQTVDFSELRNLRVDLSFHEGNRAADQTSSFTRFQKGERNFTSFLLGARLGLRFEKEVPASQLLTD